MGSTSRRVPVIDLSDLDPDIPSGERWEGARAEVIEALESFRFFEALYDDVSAELRKSLFEEELKNLFGLPLAVKMQNKGDLPYFGYIGQIPTMDYESLVIDDSENGVCHYAATLWPEGNPSFCNTVRSFTDQLSKLDRMVKMMIMESYGVEEDLDSHIRSASSYKLRVSENKVFEGDDVVLPDHFDGNVLTFICQQRGGLEVQTNDDDWIPINPLPNSFTILIGESMEAWTNGRLRPTFHRVRISDTEPRYSMIFLTGFHKDKVVVAPKELVNDEHPVLFKPFKTIDWLNFRYSEQEEESKTVDVVKAGDALKAKDALKAFCGV